MAINIHGHTMPEPWGVNEDNPVFQRNPPQTQASEVPLGLHDAVTLRSESETNGVPLQPLVANVDKVRNEDEQLAEPSQSVLHAPVVAQPAQDAAIEAADLNAHNADVAAEDAAKTAADAHANADVVHSE